MPDEMSQILRRLDMTERNLTDQAKSISELVNGLRDTKEDISDIRLAAAVNVEREKSRDEWRARTEMQLNRIYNLGWWVLTTFGACIVLAIANFLVRGGFYVK